MLDEAEFIEAARQKDSKAFGELVKLHQDFVYSVILNIVKHHADSEDVMQNVFIKVYHNLKRFDGRSKFSTWIYRIAVNESLTHMRLHKYRYQDSENLSVETDNSAQEQYIQNERHAQVHKGMESLNEAERLVLGLFYLKEQSIKEVAQVCQRTENWVKVVLHRGRKNLKVIMENSYPNL